MAEEFLPLGEEVPDTGRLAHGRKRVEVQVEFEDVDARPTEKTKLPALLSNDE